MTEENQMTERCVVECEALDVGIYNGTNNLMLCGRICGDGWSQGFGYVIDAAFLSAFIQVFGKETLKECNKEVCFATRDSNNIYLLEPILPFRGRPFSIENWAAAKATAARESRERQDAEHHQRNLNSVK